MNDKKKKIIILLSILNIPFSIFLSVIIHTKLSNIPLSEIVFNNQLLLLFSLVYLLVEVAIIMLFGYGSKSVFQSEVNSITDKLKTPQVMGQGQHGTARWLTKKEFEKAFKINVLTDDTKEFSSGGIIVGYQKHKNQEKIHYIDDNIHSLVVGATRSGKTRSIVLQTVGNLGLAGESMIISDPKAEIFHYTSDFLRKNGYEIITLDFKNPTKSTPVLTSRVCQHKLYSATRVSVMLFDLSQRCIFELGIVGNFLDDFDIVGEGYLRIRQEDGALQGG